MTELSGVFGLILLVLDLWAIVKTWQSAASTGAKVVWTLVIFFLPLLGLIIWFFAGPRGRKLAL